MAKVRQQILILHSVSPDLETPVIAWALYDGSLAAGASQMNTGDSNEPLYRSVLDAMRDGWFVMQLPPLPHYTPGHEHENGPLPYEYVLERKVTLDE